MTVREAIALVDKLKPNQYEEEIKAGWLREVDCTVHEDLIKTHEPLEGEVDAFDPAGYAELDHELLIPPPFTDVYIHYLETQIDLNNAELGKYANSMALYNAAYTNYSAWYTRRHMPKRRVKSLRL